MKARIWLSILFALLVALCAFGQTFQRSLPFLARTTTSASCGPIDPAVATWAGRVVGNGGAAVSANTTNAVNCFYLGICADGLTNKLLTVNCVVPDNLIASKTPLIVGGGLDPWIYPGSFADPDISINGLTGNGTTKCLTGFSTLDGLQDASAGVSWYYVNLSDDGMLIGAGGTEDSNTKSFYATSEGSGHPGKVAFYCWKNSGANQDCLIVTDARTVSGGFYSANRTASDAMAIYFGNSTNTFATLTNTTTAKTASIFTHDVPIITHGLYSESDGPLYLMSGTISFVAFHLGLTTTESQKLYSRVQTLRTSLGGGYR